MEKLKLNTIQQFREEQKAVIEKRLKPEKLTGGQMEAVLRTCKE